MNANWDANWNRPIWGTSRIVNDEGAWDGTWEGQMTDQGFVYHATGRGFRAYEGMKYWWHMDRGDCHGEILGH